MSASPNSSCVSGPRAAQARGPETGLKERVAYMVELTVLGLWLGALDAVAAEPANVQKFEIYSPHPAGIEIRNSKSGVVCLEGDEPLDVCKEAYTIKIVGGTMCQWSDDVVYPCTWYGYQFDLRKVEAETLVVCDVTNSIRTIFGPKTEKVTGNNTAQYTIRLEAGQGHLFHPAYHTYAPVQEETVVISVHACSVDGIPLYKASFRAFYEPE